MCIPCDSSRQVYAPATVNLCPPADPDTVVVENSLMDRSLPLPTPPFTFTTTQQTFVSPETPPSTFMVSGSGRHPPPRLRTCKPPLPPSPAPASAPHTSQVAAVESWKCPSRRLHGYSRRHVDGQEKGGKGRPGRSRAQLDTMFRTL